LIRKEEAGWQSADLRPKWVAAEVTRRIFGVVMGLSAQWLASGWRLESGPHAAEPSPRV